MKTTIDDDKFYAIAADKKCSRFWGDTGFPSPFAYASIRGAYKFSTREDAQEMLGQHLDCIEKETRVVRVRLRTTATYFIANTNNKGKE